MAKKRGDQRLRYIQPLLEALRTTHPVPMKPKDAVDWIRHHGGVEIPPDELTRQRKGGQLVFDNNVHWTRNELVRAGYMSSPKRGHWGLTEEGLTTQEFKGEDTKAQHRVLLPKPQTGGADLGQGMAPPDGRSATAAQNTGGNPEPSYSLESIIEDGCFLRLDELEDIVQRWNSKKNIILQGPPGTGKTWLAKRLGFALLGASEAAKAQSRLRVVQFHPSLNYEDFVRGYRPTGEGKLQLQDGILMQTIETTKSDPDRPFVLVIEEINRGNPAQIFGEMLTLLENTKRLPSEAIELAYRREAGERVYIPPNLFVIGTMNVADRSLALVDLALRRRFAFVDLEPQLGPAWRNEEGFFRHPAARSVRWARQVVAGWRKGPVELNRVFPRSPFRYGASILNEPPRTSSNSVGVGGFLRPDGLFAWVA